MEESTTTTRHGLDLFGSSPAMRFVVERQVGQATDFVSRTACDTRKEKERPG
jgi:hypothetical protein